MEAHSEYIPLTDAELGELLINDTPQARENIRTIETLRSGVMEKKHLQRDVQNLRADVHDLKKDIHKLESKGEKLDDDGKRLLDDKRRNLEGKEINLRDKRAELIKRTPELRKTERAFTKLARREFANLDFGTEKDGALFYQSEAGRKTARRFCNEPGNEHCKTIDMTAAGKWLNRLTNTATERQQLDGERKSILNKSNDKAVWRSASLEFADRASGTVRTADKAARSVRECWDHKSQFLQTEVPALMRNREAGKVTSFEEIKPERFNRVDSVKAAVHVNQERVHEKKRAILQGREPEKPREEGRDHER